MFPSGKWKGFWRQDGIGTHEMEQFELQFDADGTVRGQGYDIVGAFAFRGRYAHGTGEVHLTKQYLGKHTVDYDGTPDGEGKIIGTWRIGDYWSGPFCLYPIVNGDEPIQELVK